MNSKTIKIGKFEVTLTANVWALLEFKRIFGKDWYVARNEQLAEIAKALQFQNEYAGLTDAQFAKLPQEKQTAYWQGIEDIKVDMEFILATIYALAVGGGAKGTREVLFREISPKDLAADSELMQAVTELMSEFMPDVKKNDA